MKKSIIFFFLLFNLVNAQTSKEKAFIGKWEVIEVPNLQAINNPKVMETFSAFKGAQIEFNSNTNFSITFNKSNDFVTQIKQMTRGTKWSYNLKNDEIMVGSKENNYSILGFQFFTQNKEYYLKLFETEIILKIKRSKS
ncbi:hypothetical protein [Flavobacterium sp. J27]|uniref:hypothetical protein n=1 Tax=Flavobacterium sp. J27 TaxID=2060419 RepID=UPI0010322A38|nr:hypothetical protein [Flavobacterium sp. J27]